MVRVPLTPEQIAAGLRLAAALRAARGDRDPREVARAAGISPETLRKIEGGRLLSPSFGTVVRLADALGLPPAALAEIWRGPRLSGAHGGVRAEHGSVAGRQL
jgi:transcriptional regulator with XRE-family HTH domain